MLNKFKHDFLLLHAHLLYGDIRIRNQKWFNEDATNMHPK